MHERLATTAERTSGRPRGGRLAVLVLSLAAVVALSSCTGQKDPTSYSDGVKKNFVEGCVQGLSPTGVAATDPEAKAHRSTCECLIGKFTAPSDSGGVPFKEFASAQSKIRSDPAKYPVAKVLPKYEEFVKACQPRDFGPAAPATSTTTDTTVPAPTSSIVGAPAATS